jgi:uncharacterized protein
MSDLRIDVADLLAHSGSRRPLSREAVVDDLGASAARVDGPVSLDLVLERVPEGVVARGRISARWTGECGVCLSDVAGDVVVDVSELYEDHPVGGETYPLEGHVIDLDQLVRDAVLLELPLAPTCAITGAPRCRPAVSLVDDDTTGPEPVDPRWAALSELELPDEAKAWADARDAVAESTIESASSRRQVR